MAKEIQVISQMPNPDNGKYRYCFRCFNITDVDVALGLRHIKAKIKIEFRRLIKRYHPDTGNGYKRAHGQKIRTASQFKELVRMCKRLLGLQVMPLTLDNMITVFEIGKGYVSSHDVILPWDYDMPFEVNL